MLSSKQRSNWGIRTYGFVHGVPGPPRFWLFLAKFVRSFTSCFFSLVHRHHHLCNERLVVNARLDSCVCGETGCHNGLCGETRVMVSLGSDSDIMATRTQMQQAPLDLLSRRFLSPFSGILLACNPLV